MDLVTRRDSGILFRCCRNMQENQSEKHYVTWNKIHLGPNGSTILLYCGLENKQIGLEMN